MSGTLIGKAIFGQVNLSIEASFCHNFLVNGHAQLDPQNMSVAKTQGDSQ
jgi:hypothetical protein